MTPGVILIGSGGVTCLPGNDEKLWRLGGVAIEAVESGVEVVSADFETSSNVEILGTYIVPLNGSRQLPGFGPVDPGWRGDLPSSAVNLEETGAPLVKGENYSLVLIVAAFDDSVPAVMDGIEVEFTQGEFSRSESVPDGVRLMANGVQCF